jgi:predicted outer membrane protein
VKPVDAPAEPAASQTAAVPLKQILAGARRVNELEVQAGMLAKQRAGSHAQKQLGAELVREDQAANARFMAYARKHDLDLDAAAGLDAEGPFAPTVALLEARLKELASVRGADFDQAFPPAIIESHRQTLGAIKAARQTVHDVELDQIFETWRAAVQRRLDRASELGAEGEAQGRRAQQHRR